MYRPPARRVHRPRSSRSTSAAAQSPGERPVRAHSSPRSVADRESAASTAQVASDSALPSSASSALTSLRKEGAGAAGPLSRGVSARKSARTSATVCTWCAPSRSAASAPGEPGKAAIGRPCRRACFAVISEPESAFASTMTTSSASSAISSLRAGKCQDCGCTPSAKLDSRQPRCATSLNRLAWRCGYAMSTPQPSTAQVRPLTESAPRCAAASIPRAPPEITSPPSSAKATARPYASASPAAEAARAPTMVTAGRTSSAAASPRHQSGFCSSATVGSSARSSLSRGGQPGSPGTATPMPAGCRDPAIAGQLGTFGSMASVAGKASTNRYWPR